MDVDHDAVLVEGDPRRIGIDIAGRVRIAAEIVTPLGAIEELSFEGAFERLGGDTDFNGAGRENGSKQKRTDQQGSEHGFRIMGPFRTTMKIV
jgi:hypothetical protein